MTAITVEMSNTPAECLKPDNTSPPRVRAKLHLILLRSPAFPCLLR